MRLFVTAVLACGLVFGGARGGGGFSSGARSYSGSSFSSGSRSFSSSGSSRSYGSSSFGASRSSTPSSTPSSNTYSVGSFGRSSASSPSSKTYSTSPTPRVTPGGSGFNTYHPYTGYSVNNYYHSYGGYGGGMPWWGWMLMWHSMSQPAQPVVLAGTGGATYTPMGAPQTYFNWVGFLIWVGIIGLAVFVIYTLATRQPSSVHKHY